MIKFKGVYEPRKAVDGTELISPRVISTTVIQRPTRTSDDYTLVLMTWGQFITHDMTKSSSFTSGKKGKKIKLVGR